MSGKKSVRMSSRKRLKVAAKSGEGELVGKSLEVTIDRLAHDGRGIGNLEGRVVFVDQALPQEVHQIKVVSQKSKFAEATSELMINNASTDRVAPACSHFAKCGGCQIQHLHPRAQLAFKSNLVIDQLRRVKLDVPSDKVEAIVSKNELHYRTRARLSLNNKGSPYAGFKARANSQIIKIENCPVLDLSLNRCLRPLQCALSGFRPQVLGHVEMIKGQAKPILILRHVAALNDIELDALSKLAAEVDVEICLQPESEARYVSLSGQSLPASFTMSVPFTDKPLVYQANNFSQINPPVNFAMIEQALVWAKPSKSETWVDLFCGVGNLTFSFAKQAGQVIGVEAIAEMVEQAISNAQMNDCLNCRFLAADLERVESLRQLPKKIDGVILDPPRAGAKAVVENISRLKPLKILYISCDPATFARDAKTLIEKGYAIEKLGALDMFLQTMHVETMALFIKQ